MDGWVQANLKSVVFAYDGVPAHLDLAIPSQYVHSLCFLPRHLGTGFKLSESDTLGRHLASEKRQPQNLSTEKTFISAFLMQDLLIISSYKSKTML